MYALRGVFVFSFIWEKNILLAQIETINFFVHPPLSLPPPRVTTLSPWTEDDVFFLFLLFRTGICAQSENWESRTYREHNKNKRLTNPNLSAKVHEEAKQGEGRKKKTCSNIQNTKKKSYLKVALFFCCKREEGNDAMRWWKCWWCVCFVLFFLFLCPFHEWTDWLTELWLQSCLNSWEQKKKVL